MRIWLPRALLWVGLLALLVSWGVAIRAEWLSLAGLHRSGQEFDRALLEEGRQARLDCSRRERISVLSFEREGPLHLCAGPVSSPLALILPGGGT